MFCEILFDNFFSFFLNFFFQKFKTPVPDFALSLPLAQTMLFP